MRNHERSGGFRPKLICIAVASCFAADAALANPTGPTIVHGSATIREVGNVLRITNSPNTVINWNTFSINANEVTRFIQQSADSRIMNRVVGSGGAIDPSVILGAMKSNGRVYLLNPSGVLFGAGSVVDVAGLVVGTQNLSNADFLANRLRFTDGAGAGSVVNQGHITTRSGGEVYLVGAAVTNGGVITSPQGQVILAAGERVELVNPGTPNLRVEVSAKDNKAMNLGQIVADSGRVGIYAGLVDHSGTIRANGAAVAEGGRIVLRGTKNVTLDADSITTANGTSGGSILIKSGEQTLVAGTVEAKGRAGEGGSVAVFGNHVGLIDQASVDVSGDTGGGTVLVGGSFQGKNPNVPNAFRTYVGEDVVIRADAITEGDGGRIIVWSDDATRFYGNISARGGAQGGDGGFAEVSSKNWLDYRGLADLSAPKGQTGTLLLDPNNVNITDETMSGGFDDGDPNIFASPGFGTSNVHWGTVQTNLATTDVIITTSGPDSMAGAITVVNNSPASLNSPNTLRLVAHDNINVDGSISNAGSGNIELFAGWDGGSPLSPDVNGGVGNINIATGKLIKTDGAISLIAGNTLNLGASNSRVEAGGDVLLRTQNGMSFAGTNNKIQGENIQIVSASGTLAIDTGGSGGVRLAPADLGVLHLNDPDVGFLNLEGSHIDLNVPMVFDPTKVTNLSLSAFSTSSILQNSAAPLTVKNLLLLSNGEINMPAANMVDRLAGAVDGGGGFMFNNAKSLVVGEVGGTEGVSATGSSGAGVALSVNGGNLTINRPVSAESSYGGAVVGMFVTGGNLTVNQPVSAVAGGGDATVLAGATGNVTVANVISANSTASFASYGGGVHVVSSNGALQIASGGSILAQGSAYGGDAGIMLQAGKGVTIGGSVVAQAGADPDGSAGTAGIQIAAAGGPVAINQLVRASSGPGSDGIYGVAGVNINSSSNIVLNANVETLGNGTFGSVNVGEGFISVTPGIFLQAGGAIVGGNGILDAARGDPAGPFPYLSLHATQGIGTLAKPIRIKDGSDANTPDLTLVNNGAQGDIAVQFQTGDISITEPVGALLGTYNANPNGTYYIEAKAGSIELGAPFHPGLETPEALAPGQSVILVASGNIHLSTTAGPPPLASLASSGSIIASGTGKVLLDAGGSILADAGTGLGGSFIDLLAGSTINSNAQMLGVVSALAPGAITLNAPSGLQVGLIKSASGAVTLISTGGSILDANSAGLNIEAPGGITLNGAGSVGTINDPIETKTGLLAVSGNGEIGIYNTGNLTLNGLAFGGSSAAIETTGTLLGLGNPINVSATGSSGVPGLSLIAGNGMIINRDITVSGGGELLLNSNIGDMGILNAVVTAADISLAGNNIFVGSNPTTLSTSPTKVIATNLLQASTTGDFNVWGGETVEASTIVQGLDVKLKVGGIVSIAAGPGSGSDRASAQIRAGSPDSITIEFPNAGSGGYFVNGVEGATLDPVTNSGFFANGEPAVLGQNLVVTYGGTPPPVVEEPPIVTDTNNQVIATTNDTGDIANNDPDKDNENLTPDPKKATEDKKDLPVCK